MKLVLSADSVRTSRGDLGDAIAIEDGVVRAIGRLVDLVGGDAEHRAYPGAVIVPGIRDSHLHPVPYTAAISGVSLKTAADLAEVTARLRSGAPTQPGRALVALRLDDESLREQRLPDRNDLDAAITDRPVVAHRYCGHVAVANSAALDLASIDHTTPDPPGGSIDRDAGGTPTGILRETAIEIVSQALAGRNPVEPESVLQAIKGLAGHGITSVGAMVRQTDGPWASLGNEVELLCSISDELPITLHAYVIASSVQDLLEARSMLESAGPRLRWAGVKRFSDGSLGGHTAAMHKPFADQPTNRGTVRFGGLDEALARASVGAGGSVAIHAIGDRACGLVLDFYEGLVDEGTDPHLLRLEHASVLTPDDLTRVGRLGVIASVQPAFLASETDWLEKRLGPQRLAVTYPFRSLIANGVVVAAGSDCPVEPPNPWPAMAAARDRAGLVPNEGVDPAEALEMFTGAAAVALREPPPLATGSPADLVVVDRDPVAATPDELRSLHVIETYVDGKPVNVDRSQATWND